MQRRELIKIKLTLGPVRYLATLIGSTHYALLLDRAAVLLLQAATKR